MRLETGRAIRATRTPAGPATLEVREAGDELIVRSWGPGAAWAVAQAPDLLGLNDDPFALAALAPPHRLVIELARRFVGLRLPRGGRIVEALVPAVLEQKITGEEARQVYRSLIRVHGEPAPGPFGLRLQPTPERLAALPYHAYHPLGLERRRAETLKRIGALADRLEAVVDLPLADAHPISVGDYHLPSLVAFALAGESRADDARMLEILEPYRGQRGRVIRLLEASGLGVPRRGPRMPVRSIAGI
jgi:3-methyladenine DNA glycosylase/8-oxoguanine DNA glycosylase